MLFVWAQFELQVGIMCASAPALRVFFRRYLGGSQASNSDDSQGTVRKRSVTVVRESAIGHAAAQPVAHSREKQDFLEMQDLGTPASEDGGDGLSMESRVRERDLTRYSHEEDVIQMSGLK
jgi:hypothetical protein